MINVDLNLDGNVVVPHGTRVRVIGLVARPASSVSNILVPKLFATDSNAAIQDRSWVQTNEDTMYMVAHATTVTTQAPFPDPRKHQMEQITKVSTTQFALAATNMPKPARYNPGDIVSNNIMHTAV